MSDKKTKETKAAETPPAPDDMSEAEKAKLIKTQQVEIERLSKELEGLKKQLDESQAAHRAVVRKAKAEHLLSLWEEAGRDFGDDASRTAEIERLMGMSDEAFAATEETVSSFAATKKKPADEPEEDDEEEQADPAPAKKRKPKKSKASLNTDAEARPVSVPSEKPKDLAGKLTTGFMAAYKDRAGIPAE